MKSDLVTLSLPSFSYPLTAFTVFPRCCLDFLFHSLLPHALIADILLSHIKTFLLLWLSPSPCRRVAV